MTAGPSEITLEVDVSAEVGHNHLWIAVDEHSELGGHESHIPQRAQRWTVQHTQEAGVSCASVDGIRGGDVCCPAACGHCADNFVRSGEYCAQFGGGEIPGSADHHSACCIGDIEASGRICDAAAGVTSPCISPESFEWRTYGGQDAPVKIFVEGGRHVLEIISGRDGGAKIRNVRFQDRGSCGFTTTRPLDPAAVATETAECQARLASLGTFCVGGNTVPGLTVTLPAVCDSTCAGEFISFYADCRDLLEVDGVDSRGLRTMDIFLDSCNAAPLAPPGVPSLSAEECTAQFADITQACCTPEKYCRTGVPTRCTASCVDPYLAFYRDCKPTLQAVQNVDMALYDELYDMCLAAQNRGGGH
eukprot:COSAG02_NODE_30_length_50867_cov_66.594331_24_plen_361_part_00